MTIHRAGPQANQVCVVVPLYRTDLAPSELVSLDRCIAVLGTHPVILATPDTLDVSPLARRFPQVARESFEPRYFSGIRGYNQLMLADEFYARFGAYEYVLIHQLDAFVFSDRLLSWCARGYDYIGAPWIPDGRVPGRLRLLRAAIRRGTFRLLNRQYRNRPGDHHAQQHYSAGNGGFSLRRVTAMRRVLKQLPAQVEPYRLGTRNPWAEDVFFSIEANRYRTRLRIPGFRSALKFAWENHPEVAARLCSSSLPFGCHGWERPVHRDAWRPHFASIGLSLDALCAPSA